MSSMETISAGHPLTQATWIWPELQNYLINHYAQFRRDFEIPSVPKTAPLFITADKAYKLWVNGRFVSRGPARGYQSHWPFDTIELAPLLRHRHNWISVCGYNPGISTFQYLHQASAGFLCALQCDETLIVSDRRWLMRRSPAHKRTTARLSLQMDFQEHFDARLDDESWITGATPPADWRAGIFPDGAQQFLDIPFGRPPYTALEPRGLPQLRETLLVPETIVAHTSGVNGAGYREWDNVSWGFVREVWESAAWDNGGSVRSRRNEHRFELTIEPPGDGHFRAVSLLMPRYAVGNVLAEITGARGGEIVDFHFHERMNGHRPALHAPGRACHIAMANRWTLSPGPSAHEFFHLMGFSVLTLVARDMRAPLTVSVAVRNAGYPFTMRGRFECSDPTLNSIHAICRHTQQICSLDAYVDTPWREQAQWWGDARVQAKNTFFLDGDARLLLRGIRSIAGQSTPDGLTYGHAPTMAYNCILPDFSLTWILTIWDYYWQTGDTSLLVEQIPRIRQMLGYFDTPRARHPSGLLRHDRRLWLFEDWAPLFKGEIPTFINLWYLFTLRALAALSKAASLSAETREFTQSAAQLERLVLARLFDATRNVFIGGLNERMEPSNDISVHDQTLALMLNLMPAAQETMIQKRLLPFLNGEALDGPIPSAFWSTYVFEEMAKRGHGAAVLAFIKNKWSPMLATGTTWEQYEWDDGTKSGASVSHAWTAHPSFHFVNILAGITQTAPAWETIRVAPLFAEGIAHVGATIPSPRGDIAVWWKRRDSGIHLTLTLPARVTAELIAGGAKKTVRGPASIEETLRLL